MSSKDTDMYSESSKKKDDILANISFFKNISEIDIASLLKELNPLDIYEVLSQFPEDRRGTIFCEFHVDLLKDLFSDYDKRTFSNFFQDMPSEEQADFFQSLSHEEQIELLPFLEKHNREKVLRLSSYPPDTAGGIMSTEFFVIYDSMSCAAAIEKIRNDAPPKGMLYNSFVVSSDEELKGYIPLSKLIMANPDDLVSSVMNPALIFGYVDDDREFIARKIEKYDLLSLPIINAKKQLVGVVTHDEAIDVIQTEQTEDLEKFMGILPSNEDRNYLETSCWTHYKKRGLWSVLLTLLGVVTVLIMSAFQHTLETLIVLAFYIPMVVEVGGNSGMQSASMIIRAMSLGQISNRDRFKILSKELKISVLLSLTLFVLVFFVVCLLSKVMLIPNDFSVTQIALAISLAIALQVVVSTIIGATLPVVVKRFGGDPPLVASSPVVTTIGDILGLAIYMFTASYILSI